MPNIEDNSEDETITEDLRHLEEDCRFFYTAIKWGYIMSILGLFIFIFFPYLINYIYCEKSTCVITQIDIKNNETLSKVKDAKMNITFCLITDSNTCNSKLEPHSIEEEKSNKLHIGDVINCTFLNREGQEKITLNYKNLSFDLSKGENRFGVVMFYVSGALSVLFFITMMLFSLTY